MSGMFTQFVHLYMLLGIQQLDEILHMRRHADPSVRVGESPDENQRGVLWL